MAEKINPYIAGAPVVEARMFFGREETFSWMTRSLAGKYVDHILVIHGQRRVGKTSVLKHISRYLPDQYIPIFIDLQGRVSTTLDRFLWWLAREITRGLKEEGIDLPRTDRDAFVQDADYFETHFLPILEEKLGNKRLLLTFDEFDTLSSTAAQEGLALPFLAILKRMMEHEKLNFIFSIGSSGRKLENMQATYTAFFKQALYKKISFLDWDDAHDLIVKPVEGVLTYDEEAIKYIFDLSSGHPYFIQLVCHELFSTCQKTDIWEVSKGDVEEVLDSVIERGTVNLKFVWDEASNLEKWVLASLAKFTSGTDLPTLAEHLRKERVRFSRQDLETAMVNLREKDVLTPENRFVIHLMRLWLLQNRSMEQVRDELEEVDPIVSRFLEIGQEYHDAGEYEQAIGAFERALEAGPHNLEARQGLGTALLALGDYGESANEFEAALEISPDDVAAQAGCCNAYMALGDLEVSFNHLEQGEYAYRKVLQVNPQHADGLKRMAGIHHRRAVEAIVGGEEVALMELEKAKRLVPEESLFDELIDDLIALSDGKMELPEILRSWGERIFDKGFWAEAAKLFQAYQKVSGDQETVADRLTEVTEKVREDRLTVFGSQAERMTRLRRYDEAIDAWEAILALNPPNPEEVRGSIADLKKERDALQATTVVAPRKPIWRGIWFWTGLVIVAILAIWFAQPDSPFRIAFSEPTGLTSTDLPAVDTQTPTITPTPTETPIPTPTLTPAPTAIPMEWQRQDSGQFLNRDQVMSVLIDPADADVMYAGMARSGVFKTIDGGISWFPVHNGLNRGWIHNMVINPENPDEIYAGALFSGLYKTVDGGENWQLLDTRTPDFWQFTSYVAMNPADPNHLAYTGGNNIATSLDGGVTWKNYEWSQMRVDSEEISSLDEINGFMTSLAIHPVTGDLFAAGNDLNNVYLFVSGDRGRTLELVLQVEGSYGGGRFIVDPLSGEVYCSLDHHATYRWNGDERIWELWANRVIPLTVSNDGTYYARYPVEVRYSHDSGGSWIFSAPSEFGVRTMSSSLSDPDTIVAGGNSVYVSKDGGVSWEERGNGLGATRTEIGFSETPDELFLREERCAEGCVPEESNFFRYNLSSRKAELVATQGCGSNPGSAWENVLCLESIYHPYFEEEVRGWFPSPSDPGIGYFNFGPVLERTFDGGSTWSSCDNWSFSWVSEMNSAVAIHPDNPGDFYVATADGLGITRDGCSTWIEPRGLDARHINSVAINPEIPEYIYVGTDAGVYISYDAGDNWGKVNDGLLGALVIYSVSVDPNNPDNVYVSTPYGIFKLESK
jgi:tetratricopeptide (TPR) repeat protein/photosystem II stability/assembly factor-like uncharacterized protein